MKKVRYVNLVWVLCAFTSVSAQEGGHVAPECTEWYSPQLLKFNLETNLVIRHQMPSFCLMEKICLNGYHWKMERKWMPNGR